MIPPSSNLTRNAGMFLWPPSPLSDCELVTDSDLDSLRASDGACAACSLVGDWNRALILATVFGEIALRSRYTRSSGVGPFRSRLALDAPLRASHTLFAVARASLGGTMLRIVSA